VDPGHDVGVRVVPQLGAGPVEEARREEHGAVAAVEHERLAGLDPGQDLAPAAAHWTTLAREVEESLGRSPLDGQHEICSLDTNEERPRPATG